MVWLSCEGDTEVGHKNMNLETVVIENLSNIFLGRQGMAGGGALQAMAGWLNFKDMFPKKC